MTPPAPRADERWLTVDAGNSRVKLVLWGAGAAGEPLARAALAWDAALAGGLAAFLAPHARPARAALASVGAEDASAALARALAPLVERLSLAPPHGLANETRDPGGVGLDRLYAARGALELVGGPALVVDAGTALTVDAVTDARGGAFLGGAIAPGPELLARALAAETGGPARLPRVEPLPGAHALGRDTREAIRAGVAVGLRGAARALVEGVAHEAGLESAPLVLAGGARAFLEDAFPGRSVRACDDLVPRGLRHALAREERAGTGG